MKQFQRVALILLSLYLLYLIKSALGINLSDRYSAWSFLKMPINCRSFSAYCDKG